MFLLIISLAKGIESSSSIDNNLNFLENEIKEKHLAIQKNNSIIEEEKESVATKTTYIISKNNIKEEKNVNIIKVSKPENDLMKMKKDKSDSYAIESLHTLNEGVKKTAKNKSKEEIKLEQSLKENNNEQNKSKIIVKNEINVKKEEENSPMIKNEKLSNHNSNKFNYSPKEKIQKKSENKVKPTNEKSQAIKKIVVGPDIFIHLKNERISSKYTEGQILGQGILLK